MVRDSKATAASDPNAKRDSGFTLVELLVVMIVIGVLAEVAIPAFINQRQKASDTATKADVSNLGKEIASYFVDGTGVLTLDFAASPGNVVISDGTYYAKARLTNGTSAPPTHGSANLGSAPSWCVALTDPGGKVQAYHYSASGGLGTGTC